MAKLSSTQITEKLKSIAGWEHRSDAIVKRYQFKAFIDGIHFVDRIAEIAEGIDHHPDIAINYTRITFSCATHDQGGITEKDFTLANEVESEFRKQGSKP
jgi:4a-hydroxytetrahydrobiopterin dehydratase